MKLNIIKSTTIIGIRRDKEVVIAGDGQASLGPTIIKAKVKKVRRLGKGQNVIAGFAGSTADAFALFERLESKLEKRAGQLQRSCVELAKDWRTDRYLRRLEAMMIVADKDISLLVSGTGDVIESDDGILAIGSGGPYAQSAAKALTDNKDLSANPCARKSTEIPSEAPTASSHMLGGGGGRGAFRFVWNVDILLIVMTFLNV